jgi:hypothetical protein
MAQRILESNGSFGPPELGYLILGAGADWYAKWYPGEPPQRGYKIHVSAQIADAEEVARSVLWQLRHLRVHHKVVRDLGRYERLLDGEQRGKFITIYLPDVARRDDVVAAIDPELGWLGLRPGPHPTAPMSGQRVPEEPLGQSGLLFGRAYDESSPD